jgi:hypothetical protein
MMYVKTSRKVLVSQDSNPEVQKENEVIDPFPSADMF